MNTAINPSKVLPCGKNQDVTYFAPNTDGYFEAQDGELYYYEVFVGIKTVEVSKGDTAYTIDKDTMEASVKKGPIVIESKYVTTVLRGYMAPSRTIDLSHSTNLPYVNGCSTRQLFHAERLGDPTLQLLQIPAGSKEQSHHIHSTTRVVFVLEGHGYSKVGMEGNVITTELKVGMVGIFDPMTPHHFETDDDESLIVIPLHIYSSSGVSEFNHPMFNGTYLMNQGH